MEKEKEQSQWTVSEKQVFESIVYEQYQQMGAKTTVCLLILNSGFEVVGTSAPVDANIFDFAVGKKLAREVAVQKVWEYLGAITQFNMAVFNQQEQQKVQAEELKIKLAKEEKELAELKEKGPDAPELEPLKVEK